jgi:hypothetical protein
MRALRALLSFLAFSSSAVLVNGLPTFSVKDGTTIDISVEPGEYSISTLYDFNHREFYFEPLYFPSRSFLYSLNPSANKEIPRQAPYCHPICQPGAQFQVPYSPAAHPRPLRSSIRL